MKHEYVFYKTDESFDYGDFPGSTYICFEPHGFEIDIDDNGIVDINSLVGTGHYICEVEKVKTLKDLKKFIHKYKNDIYDHNEIELFKRVKKFEQLEKLIIKNFKKRIMFQGARGRNFTPFASSQKQK